MDPVSDCATDFRPESDISILLEILWKSFEDLRIQYLKYGDEIGYERCAVDDPLMGHEQVVGKGVTGLIVFYV